MIIVIDGPAGSGKSSTARKVADRLGIQYLDSGALYRALTLVYIEADHSKEKYLELLDRVTLSFRYRNGRFEVLLNEEDVTDRIRSVEVNDHVSVVAAWSESRNFANDLMHRVVKHGVYIAEGRDLGTAVFPEADLKFFMVADTDTRAKRRYRELRSRGVDTTLEEVKKNIRRRDRKDAQRDRSPLKKADDAIEIDTTHMTFEHQVQFICSKVRELLKEENEEFDEP